MIPDLVEVLMWQVSFAKKEFEAVRTLYSYIVSDKLL